MTPKFGGNVNSFLIAPPAGITGIFLIKVVLCISGSFFLPRDQQRLSPAKTTDYEGLAYLGEYPLAWAACCANESVYNLLLDVGAHPDLQDNFGNMILHMVVVCDKLVRLQYV